jgi:hypothetical protein
VIKTIREFGLQLMKEEGVDYEEIVRQENAGK